MQPTPHLGAALTAGSRLGPYEVVDLLGAGGMGEVYRARDTRLGRMVAIKVLPGGFAMDRDRVLRFEQEARAAGSLNHPNILTLHDVGTVNDVGAVTGSPFLVTELLQGVTLRERLDTRRAGSSRPREPLDVPTSVDYALQIAHGLTAAHAAGIVHRDLKPENVFVTSDGLVKILDFGLAKLAPTDSLLDHTATGPGVVMGTAGYMAPEQVRGQTVDHRADLFAFGAVLYEMLSGHRAFPGTSAFDSLGAIVNLDPPQLPRNVPAVLSRLVGACLEKDVERRVSSASELAASLRAIKGGSDTERAAARSWISNRKPWLAMALAIALLAMVAAGLWRWRVGRNDESGDMPVQRVVAVLPFDNIAADPSQDYFTAGMTEEIAAQLSRLASLRVMSRAAVARYVGPGGNLRQMGPDLGVGSLVTGAVRLADQRVRIDVQLVDARNERTLWSDQYDRELKDVFAVQSDVARHIAGALQATLSPAEAERIDKPTTSSVEAYQMYLRSRQFTSINAEQTSKAIELLRQAIRLDPQFSLAHASLARRLGWLADYGDRQHLTAAVAAAQEAVRRDPALGDAHYALAVTYTRMGRLADARLSFLKTTEVDPSGSGAFYDFSIAEIFAGHFDQALHWARRGFPAAPNVPVSYYHVGLPLLLLGADEASERWLLESERRFPTSQRVQLLLADLDFLRGRDQAALNRTRQSVAAQPDNQEGQNALAELAFLTGAPDASELVEQVFKSAPEARSQQMLPETFRLFFAYLLLRRGDNDGAQLLLDEALDIAHRELREGSEFPEVRMEIAAIHALRGNTLDALKWLEEAYRSGWRLYRETTRDPLFADVRNEPAFRALMKRMETDVAEMRRRANVDDHPRMPPLPDGAPRERSQTP